MSIKVKVSIYHCLHIDQGPFFESNDFELNDTIAYVNQKIAWRGLVYGYPMAMVLLFDNVNFTTPLLGETRLSTLVTSESGIDSIPRTNKLKLYFGLRKCKESMLILKIRKTVFSTDHITSLWRLTVIAFGSGQIITTTYTNDRNIAEIYDYLESITGLPADNLILLFDDKTPFQYTNESVFHEHVFLDVFACFQENEKLENICLKYGIKHLKSLKLRFLTKEEELNPREMGSIKDIKNYVHKTHDIPLHQQSILFQHQEIENDSTKIFDLLLQNGVLDGDLCFHLVIRKKPFEITVMFHHQGRTGVSDHLVEICDSDTIGEAKMRILRQYYPWKIENIQRQLEDTNSAVSSTGREFPSEFFQFQKKNITYLDCQTVEECRFLPDHEYQMKESLLIRIRLDSTQSDVGVVHYTIPKDHLLLYQTLKDFKRQYGVYRWELHLLPDQTGVTKNPKHCWMIESIDLDVFVVDYAVIKRRSCYIM
uniref:Uncharacterized protein n=1 Tax=Clytia hemisphaerica TaxID=252671 RepID=A0A7M5VCX1_9CNID